MKDAEIEYYELKPIFLSAYNNNHNDIELALIQTAMYTDRERSEVATILRDFIKTLKCGQCEMLGDMAPCDECYRKGIKIT